MDTSSSNDLVLLENMFRYLMYLMALALAVAVVAYMWHGFATYRQPEKAKRAVAAQEAYDEEFVEDDSLQAPFENGPRSITEALAALESRAYSVDEIADYLISVPVDEIRRDEVSGTLADYLADHLLRETTQRKLLHAIEYWIGGDAVSGLSRALSSRRLEGETAKLAIRVLARANTREAAAAIVPYLGHFALGDAAYQALREMGPVAAPAVRQAGNDGGSSIAARQVRQLLEEYGENPDSASIDQKLAQLDDPSSLRRREAAAWFAVASVDRVRRLEVLAALERARENAGLLERSSLDRAIARWSVEPAVPVASNRDGGSGFLRDGGALDDSPPRFGDEPFGGDSADDGQFGGDTGGGQRFGGEQVDDLLARDDAAALQALAGMLGDAFNGDKVAEALVAKGAKAKPYVIRYFNAANATTRLRARNVLFLLKVTQGELVTQSVDDLRSSEPERQESAADWLVSAKLENSQRRAAAEAAAPLAASAGAVGGTVGTSAKRVLARHGGADQTRQILELLADEDEKIWAPALTNLAAINDAATAPWVLPRATELLTSPLTQRQAYSALLEAGPEGEDTSIALLKQGDPIVMLAAVAVLRQIGTKKALVPLKNLEEVARRNRLAPLLQEIGIAQNEIRRRLAANATGP